MRNTSGRGLLALGLVVLFIVIGGVVLLRLNTQPRVTPAGPAGSMGEQLTPRTAPPH
jgi:hypothetical protein